MALGVGILLGGAAAFGARAAWNVFGRRRVRTVERDAIPPILDPEELGADPPPLPIPDLRRPAVAPPTAPTGAEPPVLPLRPLPPEPVAVAAISPTPPAAERGLPSPPVETLRISQRLVLHIYRQGALGPHEVAPLELCQLGMTQLLGVRQTALTKVLTRLVAAGVLSEERRHVRGQPRRLKTYQLTPLGESLARDLRRHAVPSPDRPRVYVDMTPTRRGRD